MVFLGNVPTVLGVKVHQSLPVDILVYTFIHRTLLASVKIPLPTSSHTALQHSNNKISFAGHGADVKCLDWHPHKSLLVSGSKDNQQPIKLWDPRTGSGLATL